MAEENLKLKLLKLKDTGRSDLLKSALKRLTADRREKDRSKGKKPLQQPGNKDSVRSSSLCESRVNLAKNNGGVQVASKGGKPLVKQEPKLSVKNEAKSLVKVVGKEFGFKAHGKGSGEVRDFMKVKDEDKKDLERDRESKGKNLVVKNALVKTEVKQPSSASTKIISSSTNAGASSSLGQSLRKKLMQSRTMTTTTTTKTTAMELQQKKEKKVYYLPGQKHDPPEDRDPLRIFYSTLRDQMPGSEMAEFWLMAYGLLPQDEAKRALHRKLRRGHSLKYTTPSKSSTLSSRFSNGSPERKKLTPFFKDVGASSKGKNKRDNSDSDSDEILLKTRPKKKLKA